MELNPGHLGVMEQKNPARIRVGFFELKNFLDLEGPFFQVVPKL